MALHQTSEILISYQMNEEENLKPPVLRDPSMNRIIRKLYITIDKDSKWIKTLNFLILNERLDRFEAELKRINGLLKNIFKCVQHLKSDNRRRAPTKPAILPISSLEEMDIFEDIDDDGYSEIVHYFEYIGGFTLKEAVNLCLKEALTDFLTPSFTWWGREGGPRPLYNTRLILAIYDAVCNNRYINNPTRSEFQAQMREALRTGKERWRSRARGPLTLSIQDHAIVRATSDNKKKAGE
ncbi:uncharacterized protein [Polyergus mexicanus]|uniref:uncharacterized protein n=1 Tax=Polyergus mexicanus TaxID=615972 RepID=UPI0038B534BC